MGWVAASSVGLLALFLRLWKLGTPHEFLFDETYYAKDAWSLLHFGYAREYVNGEKANAAILAGNPDGLWKDTASMAVHPDLGKWLIGLGEKAFGMDPFGWRVAVGRRRLADDRGDGPAGPPDDRVDAARRRRRPAAVLRRDAVRALAARAARHLRGVLHPAARCTATSPTATGPAPGWPCSSSPTAVG